MKNPWTLPYENGSKMLKKWVFTKFSIQNDWWNYFFISEPIGGITWLLHTSPLVVPVPFLSFRIKYIGIFFRSFLSRENLNSNFKWIFQDINYVDYRGWKRVDFAQIHDIRCKVISLKSIRPTKHKLALVKNCLSIQPNTEPIWALHCENLP